MCRLIQFAYGVYSAPGFDYLTLIDCLLVKANNKSLAPTPGTPNSFKLFWFKNPNYRVNASIVDCASLSHEVSVQAASEKADAKLNLAAETSDCLNLIFPQLAVGTSKWVFQRRRASPLVACGVNTPQAKCLVYSCDRNNWTYPLFRLWFTYEQRHYCDRLRSHSSCHLRRDLPCRARRLRRD